MSNNNKRILKMALVLYIAIEFLSFLKVLNIEGMKIITNFSSLYIPITTIILLVYASEKGEEDVCKIGITLIGINILLKLLIIFNVVDSLYTTERIFDKIVYAVERIVSRGISICSLLALFGIIPSNSQDKYEKLKTIAILCSAIYIIFSVIEIFVSRFDNKWLGVLGSFLTHMSSVSEYSFIILYLLSKKEDLVTEIKEEKPILQNTTVVSQAGVQQQSTAYNQMMQQQMVNQNNMVSQVRQTVQSMNTQSMATQSMTQPGVTNSAVPSSEIQQPVVHTDYQQKNTNY